MLQIYLTDTHQQIDFEDYPAGHPVKFVLNLKKIFPSTADLLLPILPEDEQLDKVTWESTSADFLRFRKIVVAWGVVELRLKALTAYKNQEFANQLLRQAQKHRLAAQQVKPETDLFILDYIFLHAVHALMDAELVDIGEKFYLPALREQFVGLIDEPLLSSGKGN